MSEILLNREFAETMSYWATTVGVIVALVAGLFALWRYRSDRRNQEWDRARAMCTDFMKLALEHPEFYPGCWTDIKSDTIKKNRFEWYIAHFLWSSEDVLIQKPRDLREYVVGIRDTIEEHRDYFSSAEFERKEIGSYCLPLQRLILSTVRGEEPHTLTVVAGDSGDNPPVTSMTPILPTDHDHVGSNASTTASSRPRRQP